MKNRNLSAGVTVLDLEIEGLLVRVSPEARCCVLEQDGIILCLVLIQPQDYKTVDSRVM